LLDVFDEKDAEGFRTERHEHGNRPYIYRLNNQRVMSLSAVIC
jgi:hypothetical protein